MQSAPSTEILEPAIQRHAAREPLRPDVRPPCVGSRLRSILLTVLLLAAATLAAHGWALGDGIFLDDHLHRLRLLDDHWSARSLLEATTVKPDEFIETWWQEKPIEWHYTRPVAILAAKAVYHLTFGSVKALHALSLALHFATATMIWWLCMQMTRRQFWSVVAALLFVVYSHSVYAVAWLAAQNGVLQTTLTFGAFLCYLKASRLNLYAGPQCGDHAPRQSRQVQHLGGGWFALMLLLWGLALLSRENAVVLPVLAVAADLAFAGWKQVRARLWAYAVMGVITAAFMFWRLVVLYHPMPEFYVRPPDGPGYVFWWLAKLMHYLTASVWLSPMTIGPTGRLNPFLEVPGDCLLMAVILVVMGSGYYLATRGARGFWIWPLWMVLALLPVVPVMAAPHSGYMAGVGFAIAMVLGAALRDRIRPVSIGRACAGVAVWFLIATTTYIPIYRTMWHSVNAAERYTMAYVAASPPPPSAREVFFINLPFVNIYAQLHMNEVLPDWRDGRVDGPPPEVIAPDWPSGERSPVQTVYGGPILPDRPRVHVLTYAPDLLRMENDCTLEQLDAHSFRVSIGDGRPWFSGALGRFLIESMRIEGRMQPGEVVSSRLFDAEITRVDEEGVRELVFRFQKPLASADYCFYLTTNHSGAARVQFDSGAAGPLLESAGSGDLTRALAQLRAGRASAALPLFEELARGGEVPQDVNATLEEATHAITAGLGSPIRRLLDSGRVSTHDWGRIGGWWRAAVTDDHVRILWLEDRRFEGLRRTRDALFRIRATAMRIIRTDLYLTGPPFPGPR